MSRDRYSMESQPHPNTSSSAHSPQRHRNSIDSLKRSSEMADIEAAEDIEAPRRIKLPSFSDLQQHISRLEVEEWAPTSGGPSRSSGVASNVTGPSASDHPGVSQSFSRRTSQYFSRSPSQSDQSQGTFQPSSHISRMARPGVGVAAGGADYDFEDASAPKRRRPTMTSIHDLTQSTDSRSQYHALPAATASSAAMSGAHSSSSFSSRRVSDYYFEAGPPHPQAPFRPAASLSNMKRKYSYDAIARPPSECFPTFVSAGMTASSSSRRQSPNPSPPLGSYDEPSRRITTSRYSDVRTTSSNSSNHVSTATTSPPSSYSGHFEPLSLGAGQGGAAGGGGRPSKYAAESSSPMLTSSFYPTREALHQYGPGPGPRPTAGMEHPTPPLPDGGFGVVGGSEGHPQQQQHARSVDSHSFSTSSSARMTPPSQAERVGYASPYSPETRRASQFEQPQGLPGSAYPPVIAPSYEAEQRGWSSSADRTGGAGGYAYHSGIAEPLPSMRHSDSTGAMQQHPASVSPQSSGSSANVGAGSRGGGMNAGGSAMGTHQYHHHPQSRHSHHEVGLGPAGLPVGLTHASPTPLMAAPPPSSTASASLAHEGHAHAHHLASTSSENLYADAEGPRRGNYPRHVTEHLKQWLFSHREHPYPTDHEKRELAHHTSLTMTQLNNWLINARRRLLRDQGNGELQPSIGHQGQQTMAYLPPPSTSTPQSSQHSAQQQQQQQYDLHLQHSQPLQSPPLHESAPRQHRLQQQQQHDYDAHAHSQHHHQQQQQHHQHRRLEGAVAGVVASQESE
ncbi:hypothetical protein V8E36_008369 [Tilletia maclaganii]